MGTTPTAALDTTPTAAVGTTPTAALDTAPSAALDTTPTAAMITAPSAALGTAPAMITTARADLAVRAVSGTGAGIGAHAAPGPPGNMIRVPMPSMVLTAGLPGSAAVAHAIAAWVGRLVAMPRVYRLKLHEQYQLTNYYCVPASTSMSLSTFGVKVSQATLARMMRTTTRGTGGNDAAQVMDGYLHPKRFDDRIVADVVGHPDVLMERVAYDVGALRRAPVIQVWMEKLPWNRGKIKGRWIGHAIIAYGYNKAKGTITIFDPWRPTGGAHTLPATALATTLQNGAGMHYISRL